VDLPCVKVLSDDELWAYYGQVNDKILRYLDSLDDAMLAEKPGGCRFTRLQLILGQFRHMYAHIGILNGLTIVHEDKYPMVVSLDAWMDGRADEALYDE